MWKYFPNQYLFLRSLEQWVGGLGVVIVVIGILIRPGTTASRLYKAEAREEKIKPSIANTVKTIWWIYLFYTVLGIVLYVLAGMTLFDAINNCFTNLSTGGMSIKNGNIGAYNSNLITMITILLMIIGGTSFLVHYKALKGKVFDVFRDIQFQSMIIIVTIFSILLLTISHFTTLNSIFYVVSALSCTGSNTVPVKYNGGVDRLFQDNPNSLYDNRYGSWFNNRSNKAHKDSYISKGNLLGSNKDIVS